MELLFSEYRSPTLRMSRSAEARFPAAFVSPAPFVGPHRLIRDCLPALIRHHGFYVIRITYSCVMHPIKTGAVAVVILAAGLGTHALAQSSAEFQRQAVAAYPALAQEGSPFHAKFMELYEAAKKNDPDFFNDPRWPFTLAGRVNQILAPAADTSQGSPSPANLPSEYDFQAQGRTFSSASIESVSEDGRFVMVKHAEGTTNLPADLVPKELFDAYARIPPEVKKAAEMKREIEARASELPQAGVAAKVLQVFDDGALVDYAVDDGVDYIFDHGKNWHEQEEPAVITGLRDGLVDGDTWSGSVFLVGTYRYTNVDGATKTVKWYATTRDIAAKILEMETKTKTDSQ